MSAPKRIQRRRTKGWRMPEGAIYVGRPTIFGNPYAVDAEQTREEAVEMFQWLLDRPQDGVPRIFMYPSIDFLCSQLAGHDLACWCPLDQPCHADVLLELANPTDQRDPQLEQVRQQLAKETA